MRFHIILRYMGMVLLLNALFMLIAAGISFFNEMDTGFYPLLLSCMLTTVLGTFPLIFVSGGTQISNKEGYAIVVGSWLMACLVGTFPYLLWGGEFGVMNAWFESVSGFTTTGATILNQVEALPQGLLFWRSSTHLLGGIGVVMFALVILPALGRTKLTLSSLEISSLAKDNFRYRTQKMVRVLLGVYAGMVVVETFLLNMAGMDLLDAVNHAFSNVATGGFSTRTLSIAYYNNGWIEAIVMLFMILGSLHFGLIFATFTGKRENIFNSEVSRYYLIILACFTLLITFTLWRNGNFPDLLTSLRYSAFEVVSSASTTGFSNTDSAVWPPFAIILLIFLSIQCGCAGSTSGGMKIDRILLAGKVVRSRIRRQQHPNAVIRLKLNRILQDESLISFAMIFIVIYLFLLLLGTALCAAFGTDLMTGFSISFASMGNVGPGFGDVGSMSNYAHLPDPVKVVSTLWMLLGRLEIFGLIQLFMLSQWR